LIVLQEQPYHPLPFVIPRYIISDVSQEIVDFFFIRQEQPAHPPSFLKPPQVSITAAPNVVENSLIVPLVQEQPYHPSSFLKPPQVPTIAAANVVENSLQIPPLQQEVAYHPLPRLVGGFISAQAATGVFGNASTKQEQPGHPSSSSSPGVQGPNVFSTGGLPSFIKGTHSESLARDLRGQFWFWTVSPSALAAGYTTQPIMVKQEQPAIMQPVLQSSIIIPVTFLNVLIIDGQSQEQPAQPSNILQSQFIVSAPVTISAETRRLMVGQEQPSHPPSVLRSQFIIGNVANETKSRIIVTQEQPAHPLPSLRAILPPPALPVSGTPETRGLFSKQEAPYHPYPQTRAGIQGPNVAPPPQIGTVLTIQEYPFHPASKLSVGVPPVSIIIPPAPGIVFTKSETPLYSPMAFVFGVQGPNVSQPLQALIVKQEVVLQLGSLLQSGGAFAAPAATLLSQSPIISRQERPSDIQPLMLSNAVYVSPFWFTGAMFVEYEQPPATSSVFSFFVTPPPIVAQPQGRVIVVQEQPSHPGSVLRPAVIPGNVAALPQVGRLLTIQELPPQPPSILLPSFMVAPPVPPVGRTITLQELPYHPGSQFWSLPPISVPLLTAGKLITVQEYPWHPLPMLSSGWQSPLVGPLPNPARMLSNVKVRVRVLTNKNPRTIRYN
jgi:hypothetical protein